MRGTIKSPTLLTSPSEKQHESVFFNQQIPNFMMQIFYLNLFSLCVYQNKNRTRATGKCRTANLSEEKRRYQHKNVRKNHDSKNKNVHLDETFLMWDYTNIPKKNRWCRSPMCRWCHSKAKKTCLRRPRYHKFWNHLLSDYEYHTAFGYVRAFPENCQVLCASGATAASKSKIIPNELDFEARFKH